MFGNADFYLNFFPKHIKYFIILNLIIDNFTLKLQES